MTLDPRRLYLMQCLTEGTFPEIVNRGLYTKTVTRAGRTTVKLIRAMPRNNMWIFLAVGHEPWSDPNGHQVRLKVVPSGGTKDPMKLDIKANCSCPAWKWWGSDYWADVSNYLYGQPRSNGVRPDIRDPNRKRPFCKHVVAAASHLANFKARPPNKP